MNISEDQKNEFRKVFDLFDKDGDGTIDTQELGMALRGIGQNPSEAQLMGLIKKAGGSLNFKEFIKIVQDLLKNPQNAENELKEAFKIFDRDGSGKISSEELKYAMTNLGEKLTDEEIDNMMKEADLNQDGEIDYEEFVKMTLGSAFS